MNPLIFIAWIACLLLGAGIAALMIRRIKSRPPKPKPIESNILIDPKIVPEMQHRWNCYEDMLEALKLAHEWMGHPMNNHDEHLALRLQVDQAIKKAESK